MIETFLVVDWPDQEDDGIDDKGGSYEMKPVDGWRRLEWSSLLSIIFIRPALVMPEVFA